MRHRVRTALAGLIVVLVGAATSSLAAMPAASARTHDGRADTASLRRGAGDFNGDGFADLAIGAPLETVNGVIHAGAVHVLMGSADGLTAAGSQRFTKATDGIAGDPVDGQVFGASLAAGDFNGDGFSDLAIGVPAESSAHFADGAVVVLYGSAAGLSGTGSQRWIETDLGGPSGDSAVFGNSVAAGDFDGNGVDDLAIGIQNQTAAGKGFAGAVGIAYGAQDVGLTAEGAQIIDESDLAGGTAAQSARFGGAVTAANFGKGSQDDLAVGAPGDRSAGHTPGSVSIIYGSATGLNPATAATIYLPNLAGSHPTDDSRFGAALASGKLVGGALSELVVGADSETQGPAGFAGAVYVLLGRTTGVTAVGARRYSEATTGIPSDPAASEGFGTGLTVGDFGGTADDDLAISAPGEKVGPNSSAGAVFVVPGSASGPDMAATREFTLNTPGVPGKAALGSQFGAGGLSAGDFGRGAPEDLAVGSPFEKVGMFDQAGAVEALYAAAGGLAGSGGQRWTASSPGVAGVAGTSFGFGKSLA